ncbi:DUF2975 domain-containing protein [Arthrobacter sp. zg-ZUI100]|uniref:DUF2975 domain-containing protein n=1 Tax=Arthrobacter jiangjiafuii TaxID=2817475 RepID=UPI001AED4F14|nr:DUF2975 domain-containing protein [Arthrobacter jiangjiafuii]MBP3036623.1 DUF2975 domain-containing protein [Arthrobacter jiangjiafuii]
MTKQEALPLRISFAVLVLGALLIQLILIPQAGDSYAGRFPEAAYLAFPYTIAIAVGFIGFELALLAAWQLVSTAVTERSLNSRSIRWTNLIAGSLEFMAAVFAGVCAHALFWTKFGAPAVLFGFVVSLGLIPVILAVRHGIRGWLENVADEGIPQ